MKEVLFCIISDILYNTCNCSFYNTITGAPFPKIYIIVYKCYKNHYIWCMSNESTGTL